MQIRRRYHNQKAFVATALAQQRILNSRHNNGWYSSGNNYGSSGSSGGGFGSSGSHDGGFGSSGSQSGGFGSSGSHGGGFGSSGSSGGGSGSGGVLVTGVISGLVSGVRPTSGGFGSGGFGSGGNYGSGGFGSGGFGSGNLVSGGSGSGGGGYGGGSSNSCRYWCRSGSNQFYCCENANQSISNIANNRENMANVKQIKYYIKILSLANPKGSWGLWQTEFRLAEVVGEYSFA
ncbi:glycine-rich protein 5-like [Penaeus japonicus]|uniref:glycine-rich protein 5-like n=1 Tax=Penaeus japonicus TaxID=27405 RepID=UPI001C71715A|nr:glycine-rich protein 5-like [Penaeus japonicus]